MNKFNIRVYGIFINKKQEVLVTDEYRLDTYMTKFPGGGLELGEGLLDGLRRECQEELGQDIEILRHFYTTDYFQPTRLLPEPQQLIAVYYLIDIPEPLLFHTTGIMFDFPAEEGRQSFRFIPLKEISEKDFTFPIDRKVAAMLTLEFCK